MAILDKMNAALSARDAEAYLDLHADDAVVVRHLSGMERAKAQFAERVRRTMASEAAFDQRRGIYENDDIVVAHSVNDYPDGTREAVLMAFSVKDGKITRVETGATPLQVAAPVG